MLKPRIAAQPDRRRILRAMLLASSAGLASQPAGACPSYVDAAGVMSHLAGPRGEVRLFAVKVENGARRWVSLPVQVDPLDAAGVLLPPPEDGTKLQDKPIERADRVTLRREGFGAKAEAGDPPPCKAGTALELRNPDAADAYAYLTVCPGDGGRTLAAPATPVQHDVASQRIIGPRFEYAYQPNNQLMYKAMIAKDPRWPAPLPAAADADLHMHLNVRKFFTMDFDNRDVESYVSNTEIGQVGMVGSIEFYLRLLVFKINLKMATTVGFYADSAHIPSIIDVPRDALKMLHPDSGLLYTWRPQEAKFDQSRPDQTMPFADAKAALAGAAQTVPTGLKYCLGSQCVYRLRGAIGGESFGLDINVPKQLVQMGFYPQWVTDVAQFKADMGWDSDDEAAKGQVGVYFNNSGMAKGKYRFEQWVRIGSGGTMAATCPQPVTVGPELKFASPPGIAH